MSTQCLHTVTPGDNFGTSMIALGKAFCHCRKPKKLESNISIILMEHTSSVMCKNRYAGKQKTALLPALTFSNDRYMKLLDM